jgi:uncharacterized small protein (TIGR04563 family)
MDLPRRWSFDGKPAEYQEAISMAAKVKLTLYFPEEMLQEAQQEAERQDRSISWIVQQAWRLAREHIRRFPAIEQSESSRAAS